MSADIAVSPPDRHIAANLAFSGMTFIVASSDAASYVLSLPARLPVWEAAVA